MNTIQSALSKIPSKGLPFKLTKHAYTMYRVDGACAVYLESDTQGEERAGTLHFNDQFTVIDNEGRDFSPEFNCTVISALRAL